MTEIPTHPNYEIFEALHDDEIATIYRAHDLRARRDVAIRAFKKFKEEDPRSSNAFWEELLYLASISHPHLVRIYRIDQEQRWIVLEWMSGGSLQQRIAKKAMTPDQIKQALIHALHGLECLHGQKRLHGNLHLDTLLVNEEETVKLSESVGLIDGKPLALTGSAKGLAPELVNPEAGTIGPGLDLYCLGFAALEMLKGPKFASLFPSVVAAKKDPGPAWKAIHGNLVDPLPSAISIADDIPEDLAHVIDRMVAKRATDRFSCAEEALQALGVSEGSALASATDAAMNRTLRPDEMQVFLADLQDPPDEDPPTPTPKKKSSSPSLPVTQKTESPPEQDDESDVENMKTLPPQVVVPPPASEPTKPKTSPELFDDTDGSGVLMNTDINVPPNIDSTRIPVRKKKKRKRLLEHPLVFFPMVLLLLGGAGLLAFWPFGETKGVVHQKVRLLSKPGGAKFFVVINGKEHEHQHGDEIELLPGTYQIRLTMIGYEEVRSQLDVKADDPADIIAAAFPMEKIRVVVKITSNPPDATVVVDGVTLSSHTPVDARLTPGEHTILLRKSKHKSVKKKVTIQAEPQVQTLKPFELEPATLRTFQISTTPEGAKVEIDGQKTVDSGSKVELEPGPHQITIRKDGYDILKKEILVKDADGEQKQTFELAPSPIRFAVDVTPKDAKLSLDDKPLPRDNDGKVSLKPGEYRLRVSRKGYEDEVVALKIEIGSPPQLKPIELVVEKVEINFQTKPADAVIRVKGAKDASKSKLRLKPGTHRFTITKTGYETKQLELTLNAGDAPRTEKVELKVIPVAVDIKTDPPEAKIAINGEDRKLKTNATLKLMPGKYDLLLKLDGYEDLKKEIEVEIGKAPDLGTLKLEPLAVLVDLKTVPPEATIEVDGVKQKEKSNAKLKLKPGKHKVRFSKTGYDPKEIELSFNAGTTPEVKPIQLEPSAILVDFQTIPPEASIEIDGVKQKEKSNAKLKLKPGKHKIRFNKKGYDEQEIQLTLNIGETAEVKPVKLVASPIAVELQTIPTEASIEIDGVKQKEQSNAKLNLKPGKYKIRFSKQGFEPKEIQLALNVGDSPNVEPIKLIPITGSLRAVLVAVRQGSDQIPPVAFAESDLSAVARALTLGELEQKNLTLLTSQRGAQKEELNPTRKRIRDLIKQNAESAQKRDTLLVMLSGQIIQKKNENDCQFLPVGADLNRPESLLSMQSLIDELKKSKAENLILILDHGRSPGVERKNPEGFILPDLKKLSLPENLLLLSSSTQGTRHISPTEPHSLFALSMLRALRGKADANNDARLSVAEIVKSVTDDTSESVKKLSNALQIPLVQGEPSEKLTLSRVSATLKELAPILDLSDQDLKKKSNELLPKVDLLIKNNPKVIEGYVVRAKLRFFGEKYAEVIEDCETILKLNATFAQAHEFRGDALHEQKKYDEAIDAYGEAIKLNPDQSSLYTSRATSFQRRQKLPDMDNAANDLRKAIDLSIKPDALLYLRLARLSFIRNDNETAKKICTEGLAKVKDASLFILRGFMNLRLNDVESAKEDMEAGVKLDGRRDDGYYALGRILEARKEHKKALENYKKAIEIDKTNWRYFAGLGRCHQRLGNREEASKAVQEVRRLRALEEGRSP